jgi:hypothetical protein
MQSLCVRSMSEVIELLLRESSLADLEREVQRAAASRSKAVFAATTTPERLSQAFKPVPPDLQ